MNLEKVVDEELNLLQDLYANLAPTTNLLK